ncbi:MAG TPA: cytochrome c oxidase assembly protein [Acidimicrobiales bacterium]|nr:cytochrome c oxidase assembly protein [Acidimicrobiales bacterium]
MCAVTALNQPFAWHLHLGWTLAVLAIAAGYLRATHHAGWGATPRQRTQFFLALVLLLGSVAWPLGDLAAHWSLLALVLQRLLLTLAVPALLGIGTPSPIIARLTRPSPVDAVLRIAAKPLPAIVAVTVVAVGTLTTGAVSIASRSDLARVVVQLLVLASGFVLWAPVLSALPGARQLPALGRGGYLIVQSIVPSFLCVVWIFARRPLYPSYIHRGTVLGMSPLLNQQLAGFLAKLSTIAVLWTVAFIIMRRAPELAGTEDDPEPLLWSDVEREIERADRRERREGGRG